MTVSEVADRVRRRAADRAYDGALVIFPDELALLLSEAGWLGPFPAVVQPVGQLLYAVCKDCLPTVRFSTERTVVVTR